MSLYRFLMDCIALRTTRCCPCVGRVQVEAATQAGNITTIHAKCEFSCTVTGYRITRDMVYLVKNGKISLIEQQK